MQQLRDKVEQLISDSKYDLACQLIAKEFGLTLKIISCEYKEYFNDGKLRYVFKLKLSRGNKSYTFDFGQSINNGSKEPTLYDVLSCLQKYDIGSFEDFCNEFGYNDDNSIDSLKTYKAVVKEYTAITKLFNEDELEVLREIW